jgi:hypothetical protein
MQFSSRQLLNRPKARLSPVYENSPRKVGRYLTIGIALVIGLLFIHYLTSEVGFFRVKRISVSGNAHYTQTEVIAALGLSHQRNNVHTISRYAIEEQLKQKLSYIKQAHISKSILKRSLAIEITEREPVALLKYPEGSRIRFVLVDLEGYVLEYMKSPPAPDAVVTIISAGQQIPGVGDRVHSDGVHLALRILHAALSSTPEIVPTLHTIDANRPDKITLQFSNIPVVWISSDFIRIGIYHIGLLMKNRTTLIKKGQQISNPHNGYLDARFEEAIYWGGQ